VINIRNITETDTISPSAAFDASRTVDGGRCGTRRLAAAVLWRVRRGGAAWRRG
jgi:hypothetical protein